MTTPFITALHATLSDLIRTAEHHAPGGKLTADDMRGLYRRAASIHGCTPEDARRWWEAREAA